MAENYDFLKSFSFGGKQTKHLFQVAQVNIPFLSKENEYFQVGNTNGQHFRSSRLGDYSISIDGFIIKDNSGMSVSQTKDELVKIINSNEPQELVFDVLPDRYFLGIYSGVQEYNATDTRYTPLTIVFDVPEAFARSIELDGFTNNEITSSNLFIDSNFEQLDKYFKSFVQLTGEQLNGSNVINYDFTQGFPNIADGGGGFYYGQYTPSTRRVIPNIKVGDSVGATVQVKPVKYGLPNDITAKTATSITLDFENKSVGDVNSNPNILKRRVGLLGKPVDFTLETTQVMYNNLNQGLPTNQGATGTDGSISQFLIEWNILDWITKNYPRYFYNRGVSSTATIADKLTVIKEDIISMLSQTKASGSTTATNFKANTSYWSPVDSLWKYQSFNESEEPTPIGNLVTDNTLIDDTGKIYVNVYNEPKVTGENAILTVTGTSLLINMNLFPQDSLSLETRGNFVAMNIDEWNTKTNKIMKSHGIRVAIDDITEGSWHKLTNLITITNENTDAINLTLGVRTLSSVNFSQPALYYKPSVANASEINYTPSTYSTGQLIKVTNNGTHSAPITASVTMTSENALIGFLNATNGAVLQFGNPDDVDGIAKVKNERAVHLGFQGSGSTGFNYINDKTKFISAYPAMYNNASLLNLQNGTWSMSEDYNTITPKYTGSVTNVWNGPSGVTNIPAPSSGGRQLEFQFLTRLNFDSMKDKQSRGRFEIAVMGDTTDHFMSMIIRDSVTSKDEMIVEGLLYGEIVWSKSIDKTKVKRTFWEVNMERRYGHFWFRIAEIRQLTDDKVNKTWASYTYQYNITEPDTTNVTALGFWLSRYGTSKVIKKMDVTDAKFTWCKSPYWTNVDNIFKENDLVTIDVDQRKLYVNGVENLELNTLGNAWEEFYMPLGDTYIQPVTSDFAMLPEINVTLQRRYL